MMNTLAILGLTWGIVVGLWWLSSQPVTLLDRFMAKHQRISKFFEWED